MNFDTVPRTKDYSEVEISKLDDEKIRLRGNNSDRATGPIVARGQEDGHKYADIQGKEGIIRIRVSDGYVKIYLPEINHVLARCKEVPIEDIDKLKQMLGLQ